MASDANNNNINTNTITSTTTTKPIPAFYCCYLLRSKTRKSFYIGSTPNPARRLSQHNGSSKGGAKKTSMQAKRPWEMTCIVTGFPSKLAALQFEWAWQNTHATRHIDPQVRAARIDGLHKNTKKKDSPSKRAVRPPMSLSARLQNLHHLLGVKSFERWPLHLRFFATDVFEQWEKYALQITPKLRKSVTVRLTPVHYAASNAATSEEDPRLKIPDMIRSIPVAYEDCKPYVEKVKSIWERGKRLACCICDKAVDPSTSLILVCPLEACRAVSHMSCLSTKFLADEKNKDALIPVEGTCPSCRSPLKWATLMKELSLRTHGQKEVEAMFKPKRRKKAATNTNAQSEPMEMPDPSEEDEDLDETWMEDVDDDDEKFQELDF